MPDSIENVSDQFIDQEPQQNSNVESQATSNDVAAKTDEMISKARVNEIVQERARQASQKGYERGKAEAIQSSSNTGMGGMAAMSDDRYREIAAKVFEERQNQLHEEYERQSIQQKFTELADNFMEKIASASEAYPDLMKRQDEIGELSALVPYINETSNVPGVVQHILDNEQKYASLMVLSQTSPALLRRSLDKIASSIDKNEEAVNRERPNAPLSWPTPSNNAMDSGAGSIEALKQQDWLRG